MTAIEPATEPWGPAPDGLDLPHWEGLVEGELRLQRCNACRAWIWGPQAICGSCHGFDIGWEKVEPAGTVYSWHRSWYPYMDEYAGRLPYVTVLVELPGADGRRVLGLLVDDIDEDPRIGDEVVGAIELDEGARWPLVRWCRVRAGSEGETR
ncbi:zinc ribbon domain-containing protein [Rhodococcus sp. Z13]|uniref:Zinc ribbon domain-containing protein n=1 Tax=Rhodococcus sacchari TaxID=2962047 RepID=A0ACD4DF22_9NOCA|nr:zinc ribbon domain-containing protein [Rhodococcus sp. Z13]UYP18674.1 zinc ribbon domain-containing protein [Rhodococcus sp. Z13]